MVKSGSSRDDTTVAVAIDRDKNSQHAVRWAVDNLNIKNGQMILIHVHVQENLHSHSHNMIPKEGHSPSLAEMNQFFLPYRGICARKGIQAKEVILQDDDVAHALAEYITQTFITTIVVGASTRNALARAFKNQDVPSSLTRSVPEFCSIYAISRGKVLKLKSASQPATPSSKASSGQSSQTGSTQDSPVSQALTAHGSWRSTGSSEFIGAGSQSISFDSSNASDRLPVSQNASPNYSSASECTPQALSDSQHSSTTPSPNYQSVNNINDLIKKTQLVRQPGSKNLTPAQSLEHSGELGEGMPQPELPGSSETSSQNAVDPNLDFIQILNDRHLGNLIPSAQYPVNNLNLRIHTKENSSYSTSGSSNLSGSSNFRSSDMSFEHLDSCHISDASRCSVSSQNAAELEEEMKRLKLELKQTLDMYNETCRRQAREIDHLKSEEACKLEEAKEAQVAARAMVEKEKQKCKAALEVARMAQQIAELESEKRKRVEQNFLHEAEEMKKAQDAFARSAIRYRRYSIDEIEAATNYFSNSKKIGEGGYGPVYKAYLDHTAVAIKVLRSDMSQGQTQFQQELEVLNRLRHPNVVLLLGACPEYGCLVYEYMENGSLEDRLFCKNQSPPIPWPARFRIAAEIAAALHFFHRSRPEPIVHRDLKPANILLDTNYKSKISDVGLARLVPASVSDSVTQYIMTSAAGTFCYIDPEYQQTGMLNPKSDIYSLGIMLLQIITARPPMGLTHHVERSIEKGNFDDILDPSVNDWPLEEALSLAKLALKCCELRRKDRPDLGSDILPELERLKDFALDYRRRGRFTSRPTSSQESLAVSEEVRSGISDNQSDKVP
ncbi:U-box domain-containing protein 35-like [Nicotiana tomentosiformis]|uniref:U-box domain-containing protein 35-like n=1 Tax=Nicotiana tomentosiformis TaxID=4098 RepID=UPI00051AF1F7|nr:U-box domain-containing protein 52-like [Nicotiana tomentosiformis]XP_018633101.1 U-box domain-containing protein 52-like [Nicotiana tomentosiformis]